MEIITTIISALSGIIGVTKNFLGLRISLKELFKKDISLNKAFADLSKRDEAVLSDLYRAIEMGKELTGRIYKKLALKYIVTIVILFLVLIAGVYVLQTAVSGSLKTYLLIGCPVATYLVVTQGIPIPIKVKDTLDDVKDGIYRLRKTFGFISWMTPLETNYLQNYLDLCSLRDTLEMQWISKKIIAVTTYVFETKAFRETVEKSLIDVIEDVLKKKEHVRDNIEKIKNEVRVAGFERFLLLFDDGFFHRDFQSEYDHYKRDGIKRIVNQYWTV